MITRAVHRVGNAAPQVRAGCQICVIAKYPQRAQLAQPPPDMVQTLLDSADDRPITVCVGQKRIKVPLAVPAATVATARVGLRQT